MGKLVVLDSFTADFFLFFFPFFSFLVVYFLRCHRAAGLGKLAGRGHGP